MNFRPTLSLPAPLNRLYRQYPLALVAGGFALLALVWMVLIIPMFMQLNERETHMEETLAAVSRVQQLSARIRSLEDTLGRKGETQTQGTLNLQTLEQIARDAQVYPNISELLPVELAGADGRIRRGYTIQFDKISMARLIPFLANLSEQALSPVQSLSLRRSGEEAGQVQARVTVMGVNSDGNS